MRNFIKKRLLTMSIALVLALPYTTSADKPDFPSTPGICTMSIQDTSRIPLDDDPDIITP